MFSLNFFKSPYMATIYDFIYIDRIAGSDVQDSDDQETIVRVANKLQRLEKQILQHPEGRITIKPSGNVFVTGFPDDLMQQIHQHLR